MSAQAPTPERPTLTLRWAGEFLLVDTVPPLSPDDQAVMLATALARVMADAATDCDVMRHQLGALMQQVGAVACGLLHERLGAKPDA